MKSLCLVTPALAAANNGNWRIARRRARHLVADYRVRVVEQWEGGDDVVLLAWHARRFAASVAACAAAHPERPLLPVLSGSDLCRDSHTHAAAQGSLALARRSLVLHRSAAADLPPALRPKCAVCLQSAAALPPLPKVRRHLGALMVGLLRDEKWPQTLWHAAARLQHRPDILIDHIAAPLDPARSGPPPWPAPWPAAPPTRVAAGWAHCRMPRRCAASARPMGWCTAAAWKAAPMG